MQSIRVNGKQRIFHLVSLFREKFSNQPDWKNKNLKITKLFYNFKEKLNLLHYQNFKYKIALKEINTFLLSVKS